MRARKKDLREMEDARRASLADEEACWMRVVESSARASSSRNVVLVGGTADRAIADEDTTDGVQITEVMGSGELDPPAC